ncbi:hypothetical protein C479_07041 [Halovivax asiaticus JCM 14624]|uniref:Uncharacterized protein n=1 Tax=Halovivax asiaticus JCM 14624 TaxID=1227490 RepID=M0BPT0_9EURY|nr:hypothetical protein [Halovivax asiaticus]ELZ11599.1 hypothetical protein C479_07041 [Halovivax asiaticus JCM 14624]
MEHDLNRTHSLLSDHFGEAFTALFEHVTDETTAAVVRVDEGELSLDIEGDETRSTWESVRDRFERVADGDGSKSTWRCPTTTAADRSALANLFSQAAGIVGTHFVHEIELRRDGQALVFAVPHHQDAFVDATVSDRIDREEIVALPCEKTCLVPTEPAERWVEDDREWSLAGTSLCVERRDGRRTNCYGLSNLHAVSIAADGTLELTWDAGTVGDDVIGRALTWVMKKFYRPPTAVPCPDHERARAVRARMQAILAAYDGRGL